MDEPVESRPDDPLELGFRLGELLIDPHEGQVSGRGGLEKLDPKVMDVLVMLARHAGHVVLREDLLSRLWPNTVVTDDVLSRCIYELRRQLSLAGGDERLKTLIETMPKRGYRLNGNVSPLSLRPEPTPEPATASPRPASRAWLALGIAVPLLALGWMAFDRPWTDAPPPPPSAQAAVIKSIAVLPFDDMSAEQDQGYLADGIADEIISRLSRSGNLRVISRWSSFSFRDKAVDIREIAKQLQVNHLLEGSVRKSGDSIRITAQLIAAGDNSHVWSQTFDRKLDDLFAVQDEIAIAVATALRATLEGIAAPGGEAFDHEALEAFWQGEFFYNRRGPDDIDRAGKYYGDALALEPDFARAWAALAGVYSLMAYEGKIAREEGLEKQAEAARKAVALNPQLAAGHARLAQYYWDTGDRRKSYEIFDRAFALDPDDPLVSVFVSGIAMRNGNAQEAIERHRRIVSLDPRSASHRANLGMYLKAAGQYKEAEAELRKALELNPEAGGALELALARVLILARRFDSAESAIRRLREDYDRDHGMALLAHARGHREEADAALRRLIAHSTKDPDVRLAEVYAVRGMKEEAFGALEGLGIALQRDEPRLASQIWSWQVELRVSPFLKSLHTDPRWTVLLTEPP